MDWWGEYSRKVGMAVGQRGPNDAPMHHNSPNAAIPTGAPVTGVTTSLNPFPWSQRVRCDQGQLRTGVQAIVTIGGQRPVDAQGRLLHEGDLAAQLALTLDNLTEVVLEAGLRLTDLAHLRLHTTDIVALLDVAFVVTEHLAAHGATTPVTTVEVSGLAIAGMQVEIDGLAVRTAS